VTRGRGAAVKGAWLRVLERHGKTVAWLAVLG
jgi:hypothetical protein